MLNWTNALTFSLSVLVACSSSNKRSSSPQATDGGGDVAASYAAYCANGAQATCNAVASCCNMTVDACRTAAETMCLNEGPDFSGAGYEFNSASAQTCVASMSTLISGCAYASTSSPEYQAAVSACRNVLVGTLPPGSNCAPSNGCAAQPGSVVYCDNSNGVARCVATPLLKEGDACDIVSQIACSSGLYCDLSKAPTQCVPIKADGATCQRANECVSSTCTNSTCAEPSLAAYCQTLKSN